MSLLTLRLSGDPASSTGDQAGFGMGLSVPTERALLEWRPVNSRLFEFRLDGSVHTISSQLSCRCLFVVSVTAPNDCRSPEVKDEL